MASPCCFSPARTHRAGQAGRDAAKQQARARAGEAQAGIEHDVYVQLRDSNGNRITTDSADGRVTLTCNGDATGTSESFLTDELASFDTFCAAGYPSFVDHADGVWHFKVQARSRSSVCWPLAIISFRCTRASAPLLGCGGPQCRGRHRRAGVVRHVLCRRVTVAPVMFGRPLLNNALTCDHVQVQK